VNLINFSPESAHLCPNVRVVAVVIQRPYMRQVYVPTTFRSSA